MAEKARGMESRRLLVPEGAFNPCYRPYVRSETPLQIYYGGAGSGKSAFLAARCLLDALCGRNTLVVRQVMRTLKSSCFAEIEKAAGRLGLSGAFRFNRAELGARCLENGAQILFLGLDDPEKLKSLSPERGSLTDIWVEEATEIRYDSFKQLEKRLRGQSRHRKRISLSFNPVSQNHWIYREFFMKTPLDERGSYESEALLILKTTHRDNLFLTDQDHQALENEGDAYYREVYTLGNWGLQSGLVLPRWRAGEADRQEDPFALRCGLDFGFAADPSAIVVAAYEPRQKRVQVLREALCPHAGLEELALEIKRLAPDLPVAADCAEPRSIAGLRALGVRAYPVKKGADSVRHGLKWLARQDLRVSPACPLIMRELQGYHWQQDKEGRPLDRPQGDDHLIDALRYALESDMLEAGAQALKRRWG